MVPLLSRGIDRGGDRNLSSDHHSGATWTRTGAPDSHTDREKRETREPPLARDARRHAEELLLPVERQVSFDATERILARGPRRAPPCRDCRHVGGCILAALHGETCKKSLVLSPRPEPSPSQAMNRSCSLAVSQPFCPMSSPNASPGSRRRSATQNSRNSRHSDPLSLTSQSISVRGGRPFSGAPANRRTPRTAHAAPRRDRRRRLRERASSGAHRSEAP